MAFKGASHGICNILEILYITRLMIDIFRHVSCNTGFVSRWKQEVVKKIWQTVGLYFRSIRIISLMTAYLLKITFQHENMNGSVWTLPHLWIWKGVHNYTTSLSLLFFLFALNCISLFFTLFLYLVEKRFDNIDLFFLPFHKTYHFTRRGQPILTVCFMKGNFLEGTLCLYFSLLQNK